MAIKKQSLQKLSEIMDNQAPNGMNMLYRNTFACACYLSVTGEKEASLKLLFTLFDQLDWSNRKTYFINIKDSLAIYAREYASEIQANQEINKLFKKPVSGIADVVQLP